MTISLCTEQIPTGNVCQMYGTSRTIEFDPVLLLVVAIYDKPDGGISISLSFDRYAGSITCRESDARTDRNKEWCG